MVDNAAHKNPRFLKELKLLQDKWPAVRISAEDRAQWNSYMQKVNERSRLKKKQGKRKKPVAT